LPGGDLQRDLIGATDPGPPRDEPESEELVQVGASLAARPYAKRGVSMSDKTIRVMLVDDHAMVREGLRLLLRAAPDIAVVGEAGDGVAAIALAERVSPDIVVLDLDLPNGGGMSVLRELSKALRHRHRAEGVLPESVPRPMPVPPWW